METRFRSVLLALAFLVVALPAAEVAAQSDEDAQTNLIEPQIERVDFDESLIDSADFEIALYGGFLAVEDFDTNFVSGIKLGYHITEDFFVQASYGSSSVGETSFEKLTGGAPLLSSSERDLEYYFGAGHRTAFTDNFSLDIEMRDLIFDMDIFGSDETTHNLEFTLAINLFF
jgi:opacity protein-like surface antigen